MAKFLVDPRSNTALTSKELGLFEVEADSFIDALKQAASKIFQVKDPFWVLRQTGEGGGSGTFQVYVPTKANPGAKTTHGNLFHVMPLD